MTPRSMSESSVNSRDGGYDGCKSGEASVRTGTGNTKLQDWVNYRSYIENKITARGSNHQLMQIHQNYDCEEHNIRIV